MEKILEVVNEALMHKDFKIACLEDRIKQLEEEIREIKKENGNG